MDPLHGAVTHGVRFPGASWQEKFSLDSALRSWYTALRNLLNQSYESYNRYPMPGLNITAGLRAEY
jgi:hypothetical protein